LFLQGFKKSVTRRIFSFESFTWIHGRLHVMVNVTSGMDAAERFCLSPWWGNGSLIVARIGLCSSESDDPATPGSSQPHARPEAAQDFSQPADFNFCFGVERGQNSRNPPVLLLLLPWDCSAGRAACMPMHSKPQRQAATGEQSNNGFATARSVSTLEATCTLTSFE
jgi:hypothetical protein